MNHLKQLFIIGSLFILLAIPDSGIAQQDEPIQTEEDTIVENFNGHSPKKAAWMSALLPGLGQIYNDKIWKVPIIYGLTGVVYYFYDMNADLYQEYKQAYNDFNNGIIEEYKGYDEEQELRSAKEYYRRNRDLNIILFGAIYLANILDASVDAHLYNFDISKDLSLEIKPTNINQNFGHPIPAISCSFYF